MRRLNLLFGLMSLVILGVIGCEVAPDVQMSKLMKRREDYQVAKF